MKKKRNLFARIKLLIGSRLKKKSNHNKKEMSFLTTGYMTGTFDVPHVGHVRFLRTAKSMCDRLVVGLTDDITATSQKRVPFFNFEHRRSILNEFESVDLVVEHSGVSKEEAFNRIRFQKLFTCDEYLGTEEFTTFATAHPEIEIIYIPRVSFLNSSKIIESIENRFLDGMSVLAPGIGGLVQQFKMDKRHHVVKPICIGASEQLNTRGSDSYNIAVPPPRNWKFGKVTTCNFPMIAGVNGYREIIVQDEIKHCAWSPFLYVKKVFQSNRPIRSDITDNIQRMQQERKFPSKIFWLVQKFCGPTLKDTMATYELTHTFQASKVKFKALLTCIEKYIKEMNDLGVVHGDLHASNICVNKQNQIFFLDFGWCLSLSFSMDDKEKVYFKSLLDSQFDLKHFLDSLEGFGLDRFMTN
jgi:cytidyltransferase-like protein